ncbi:hypothetical protein MKK88_03330 [Methylobacterium sp. E-005]|uniref:hypothetical protein n=1 Tax=Methylobacterium sp. E-005 TaxID=2836549 RepID=UPI001FB9CB99|nr:hypothetical protein [Methylobacterium sp. E-005]MCJ2085028.1 hypothetical protein [Methylobacterium sp. E-005]
MPAVHQATLPLPRLVTPRVRSCRRPFVPSPPVGPYRLPAAVLERLAPALEPFRNRDAALALAVFLGCHQSFPARLGLPFPIDRRALVARSTLDLTEAQVRGAIRTLEAVGFLDRAEGRRLFQATVDGLHRKPILFQFGPDALRGFEAANRRALACAEQARGGRRPLQAAKAQAMPSRRSHDPVTAALTSPKEIPPTVKVLSMGEQERSSPRGRVASPIEPSSALENALARLAAGVIGTGRA